MSNLLSQNQEALKILFTDDIYFIRKELPALPGNQNALPAQPLTQTPAAIADSVQAEGRIPEPVSFEYQGENNKYFLILIDDKIHTRMNPVHLEMLLKVMGAKKLELRDLAILNVNRYPGLKFNALKNFFSCNRLVMFGVSPELISMPPARLNKLESAGSVKVLITYSLEEMRNDADKKREFWNVMKNF